jgi:hypothetical protein
VFTLPRSVAGISVLVFIALVHPLLVVPRAIGGSRAVTILHIGFGFCDGPWEVKALSILFAVELH